MKTVLTTENVPKYIRDIASRLYLTTDYTETDIPGYTFKLYGKHRIGYENMLLTDCERLLSWCQRWYADAHIVSTHMWYEEVPHPYPCSKWQKHKAYVSGHRNYIKVLITDPVAHRFEKDGFYREKQEEQP